jgi:hypothetical protein
VDFSTSTEHQLAGRLVGNMVLSSLHAEEQQLSGEWKLRSGPGAEEDLRWDKALISSGPSGATEVFQ